MPLPGIRVRAAYRIRLPLQGPETLPFQDDRLRHLGFAGPQGRAPATSRKEPAGERFQD